MTTALIQIALAPIMLAAVGWAVLGAAQLGVDLARELAAKRERDERAEFGAFYATVTRKTARAWGKS